MDYNRSRISTEESGKDPKKLADKNVLGRMFAIRPKASKAPIDESFDMIPDFESDAHGDRKRSRENPFLASPQRKQARSTPPVRPPPPTAYRQAEAINSLQSLPARKESMPPVPLRPPTPIGLDMAPASIPLPASPPKSASSWLNSPPILPVKHEPDSPRAAMPALHIQQSTPRKDAEGAAASPGSDDIYSEFDRLFADFPRPPTSAQSHLLTPGLTSASSSSYSLPNPHSRPVTPLSPYPPPDPTRLESAINTLAQISQCLQGVQTDQSTYLVRQADLEARVQSLQRELAAVRGENVRLEVDVRREKEERARTERSKVRMREDLEGKLGRAEEDRVKAIQSLQSLQAEASTSSTHIHTLSSQLAASQVHSSALQSRTKDLEAEVNRLNSAFGIVKADYQAKEAEMRTRMEEAEFMHSALKESGARLGRELEGARRKYSELEKKGRGGFI